MTKWLAVENSDEGEVEVRFSPGYWNTPDGGIVRIALPAWEDEGLATVDSAESPAWARLSPALWTSQVGRSDDSFHVAEELRRALDALLDVSPALWSVSTGSYVGAPRLEVTVQLDGRPVQPPAHPLLDAGDGLRPLSPEAFSLLSAVREWNARPAHTSAAQLLLVDRLQRLSRSAERTAQRIELDEHLINFEIEHPKQVKLAWETSARRADMFDLRAEVPTGDGKSVPLPLDALDSQEPVMRLGDKRFAVIEEETAQALRHARERQQSRSRRDVARVLHDPASALPPGIAPDSIDLSEYSQRVKGFERVVRAARAEDIERAGMSWFETGEGEGPFLELDVTSDPAQPPTRLTFETPEVAEDAKNRLDAELERGGKNPVKIADADVLPSRPIRDRLDLELSAWRSSQRSELVDDGPPVKAPPRLAAVIDEEAELDGGVERSLLDEVPWPQLEGLLREGVSLKEHQRGGVAWLWYHLRQGSKGVLLADDMGLGKTFQVACLLMLHRAQRRQSEDRRPSLVVAPVVLIENWVAELQRFFRPEALGSIVALHGDGLTRMRQGNGLDLERLGQTDIVITNYETLARFQVDLLKVDWLDVVLDEAHNIKTPDTLRTRAACGLKREFAVCLTGTPVENRMLDLWSLFFFLSPNDPFGARKDFETRHSGKDGAEGIRSALAYPSDTSRVLRRTKDKVLELPEKKEHEHLIEMSEEQVSLERRIVKEAGGPDGMLKSLTLLRKLYAHPWLLREKQSDLDLESAMRLSPKFARCLEILDGVRERGEKAIIFSLFMDMQRILVEGIRARYGLKRVHVINGESNQKGASRSMLDEFDRSEGFDVIVLSPIAAGVGLTITAANHVIHYDRWWNPAKEDQATDRAYRIGQTRPVHVHYPMLHRPGNQEAGFDRKLHMLVCAKRKLARDFLQPAQAMEPSASDLMKLIGGEE